MYICINSHSHISHGSYSVGEMNIRTHYEYVNIRQETCARLSSRAGACKIHMHTHTHAHTHTHPDTHIRTHVRTRTQETCVRLCSRVVAVACFAAACLCLQVVPRVRILSPRARHICVCVCVCVCVFVFVCVCVCMCIPS